MRIVRTNHYSLLLLIATMQAIRAARRTLWFEHSSIFCLVPKSSSGDQIGPPFITIPSTFVISIITRFSVRQLKEDSGSLNAGVPGVGEQPVSSNNIEARFLIGLRDLETGKPDKAIEAFSAILAADPTLIRVRLELARAYFAAEKWDRARQEFFIVLSGDLQNRYGVEY